MEGHTVRSSLRSSLRSLRGGAAALGWLVLAPGLFSVCALPLWAGTTGTTALFTPQGSGTTTAQGEFITAAGGLDVPFRYFIEVPPGTPELFVDLFDADVGAGGAAESGAQRDRARGGFDTAVTYRLLDPAGAIVSTLTLGAAQNGTFDNAWTSPFGSRTFRDEFSSVSYANNDGSQVWASDWIEVDSGPGVAGPTGGNVLITGGQLALDDQPDTAPNPDPSLARQANLSSFQSAVLLFDFATSAGVDATDSVVLEISNNGGATYVTAENFTGITGATSGSRAYNLPAAFLTATFRLRFRVNNLYGGGNETFQVDNVEIRVDGRVAPTPGHWQLQVDVSSAVTGGDDIHALGIRSHDGSPGAGGTELNAYYLSQSAFGTNPGLSRVYPVHPYVTSGCTLSSNDFDMDSNGSTTHTSRTGAFTQTLPVSGNDAWLAGTVAGWTTDQVAGDYGIWNTDFTVTTDATNGNYGHLYLGSFQAAAPPPTANPETDTFRVYLPTDVGAAPAKPYLEQLLTFVSGPNPPVQGQTTQLSVTVRLVNPTPHAIAFSAPTNVITANVPGSGVTYAGSAQISQGSLVSQPAIGGTGNVVWNPGTVAAGQTELLAYRVDVTPAAASFDLPVTGTPASNGTRSLFVDETGAQTFLFGPLCELRVQDDALTHATVSAFQVEDGAEGPAVLWQTVSEAGAAGFRVLRRESPEAPWMPIHEGLLSGPIESPQGATYRWADPRGPVGDDTEYLLVEVETTGRERRYGPYPAAAVASPDGPLPLTDLWAAYAPSTTSSAQVFEPFEQWPREAPHTPQPHAQDALAGESLSAAEPTHRRLSGEAMIEISGTGLVRVSAERLAEVFGLRPRLVSQLILTGGLELTLQGHPVAWTPLESDRGHRVGSRDSTGILFYGQSVDTLFPDGQPFTDRNVYRLRLDRGLRMRTVRGRPPRSSEPGDGFHEILHVERDVTPVTALPLDPDGDFWLWAAVNASRSAQATATFDLDVPEASPAGTGAELTLHLLGASSTSHPVEIYADGSFLGETTWDGITWHTVSLPLSHELLEDGALQVEITGLQEPGAPANQLFVDGFDIGYLRRYRAAGASVEVEAAGAHELTVTGFDQDDVQVFDISDPRAPKVLERIAVAPDPQGDGFRVSFDTSHPLLDPEGRYLLATPGGIHEPITVRAAGGAGLDRDLGAEYLVVAPRELIEPARALADLRASRGLASAVVALEDVYDHVAHGLADPRAVRDFLQRAVETWRTPPRWVALVGAGTVDPRDLLGFGDTPAGRNLLTPLLVATPQGLFASDARFTDFDGDGLADVAIGRLPMTSADQLRAYVERLQRRQAAFGTGEPWTRRALLATDDPDFGGDFTTDGDRLAPLLFQDVLTRVGLETVPLASAREAVQNALRDGVSLFGWVGHSGQDRMAAEGLLTLADLPGLLLADRPPVVFALTCTLARFELPFPSLGGELLRSPEGAMAVWAPSGLSNSHDAVVLGDRFLRELFHGRSDGEPVTLGEAVRQALGELRAIGADNATTRAMVGVYNLLGDPAIVLPLADPVSTQGAPGE